jgi:hypothetical protein
MLLKERSLSDSTQGLAKLRSIFCGDHILPRQKNVVGQKPRDAPLTARGGGMPPKTAISFLNEGGWLSRRQIARHKRRYVVLSAERW